MVRKITCPYAPFADYLSPVVTIETLDGAEAGDLRERMETALRAMVLEAQDLGFFFKIDDGSYPNDRLVDSEGFRLVAAADLDAEDREFAIGCGMLPEPDAPLGWDGSPREAGDEYARPMEEIED